MTHRAFSTSGTESARLKKTTVDRVLKALGRKNNRLADGRTDLSDS